MTVTERPAEGILFLYATTKDNFNDVGQGHFREFKRLGASFLDYKEIYRDLGFSGAQRHIREFISSHDIKTLVVAADPTSFHFPLSFFREIRETVFTVMMAGDTCYYFDVRDKHYAGAMDLFFIYDSFEAARRFRELGGDALMFLPAFDRARYCRLDDRSKTFDVSFVGGVAGRPDRQAYVDYLLENGVKVELFGFGTPGGQVSHEKMVEIFNRSRINLNFTGATVFSHLHRPAPLPPDLKQIKGRQTEVALCGSFMLSEYAPGLENILVPGREMDTFSGREELLAKIRLYLGNEAEREKIAENGYLRAVREYELVPAIGRMLEQIEERRASGRRFRPDIPEDESFRKNFSSFRMLCILQFLKSLRFGLAAEELALLLRSGPPDISQLYTFFVQEFVDRFPRAKALLKRIFLTKK